MADITMCSGVGCDISHKCYRHIAKPDKMLQSYFAEPPIKNGECDMFWEIKEEVHNDRRNTYYYG